MVVRAWTVTCCSALTMASQSLFFFFLKPSTFKLLKCTELVGCFLTGIANDDTCRGNNEVKGAPKQKANTGSSRFSLAAPQLWALQLQRGLKAAFGSVTHGGICCCRAPRVWRPPLSGEAAETGLCRQLRSSQTRKVSQSSSSSTQKVMGHRW